jgi:PIN domain nuclease of toxin-antitoxin system
LILRLLLDTHILIWLMEADARLKDAARAIIVDAEEVHFSSASIWEIAIKARLGKIRTDPEKLLELSLKAGLRELVVTARHGVATKSLPLLHRDPFDRLLVAQAQTETMRLITADPQLATYSQLVIQA